MDERLFLRLIRSIFVPDAAEDLGLPEEEFCDLETCSESCSDLMSLGLAVNLFLDRPGS